MIKVCTMFEDWLIEDGTYPELHKGQKIKFNLTLEIKGDYKIIKEHKEIYYKQLSYSEYSFCGKVLSDKNYINIGDNDKLILLINIKGSNKKPAKGDFIEGTGDINIDVYSNLVEYEAIIDKIYRIKIPDKFISRSTEGMSSPCSLTSDFYSKENIEEADLVPNNLYKEQSFLTEEVFFYMLDLKFI